MGLIIPDVWALLEQITKSMDYQGSRTLAGLPSFCRCSESLLGLPGKKKISDLPGSNRRPQDIRHPLQSRALPTELRSVHFKIAKETSRTVLVDCGEL